jgi:hypothetical protein
MEVSPLIFGIFALLLSLTGSGLTLKTQATFFEPLTTRTTRFDCEDPMSIMILSDAPQPVSFSGESEDCMLPNLYKERAGEVSDVEELFAAVFARCNMGGCR